ADGTTESARQITQVTQEQRTATERVTDSSRQIAMLLAQSVASAQKTRSSADVLRAQAEQLAKIIGRFRLEQGSVRHGNGEGQKPRSSGVEPPMDRGRAVR